MESEGIELPSAIAAVRLLVLTGCRLGEIMMLQWEHVDFPNKAFRLPDSKTGAKVVHVGPAVMEVLKKIDRVEVNPWVIAGINPGARLTDLQPFWQRVRARVGLKDARIHDLRHTFASTAVGAGQGLPMIGKLLGQASPLDRPMRCLCLNMTRTRVLRLSDNLPPQNVVEDKARWNKRGRVKNLVMRGFLLEKTSPS
jgi:integrase